MGRAVLATAGLWVLLLSAQLSFAQAVVRGAVVDVDGATPLPGVTVTLTNALTNFEAQKQTNDDGEFEFPGLPPKEGYQITALQNGKTIETRVFALVQGQTKLVLPPLRPRPEAVEAGSAVTPAAASAATTSVDTGNQVQPDSNSSFSENVKSEQLRSLPLFNRTFLALGLLSPDGHDVPGGSPLAGATFSIAGNRPTTNNFLLDGTDNVASSSNQAIPFQVNDSIQEFRVVYSNATAEYGRGQGGVIDVVTSSATNHWHGGGFGYFNNDIFNANTPLSVYSNSGFAQAMDYAGSLNDTNYKPINATTLNGTTFQSYSPRSFNALVNLLAANPSFPCGIICGKKFDAVGILAANDSHTEPLDQKQFGAHVGGPLTKKILLFSSYEGTLVKNPNPIFERVPTAFDRTVNPALAGNASAVFAQQILSVYPKSNVVAVPNVLEFYKGTAPNYTNAHNVLLRADYNANQRSTYLIRYNGQLLDQLHDDSLPAGGAYPGNGAIRRAQNQSALVANTYSSAKGWVNDARVSVTHFRLDDRPEDSGFNASPQLPTAAVPTFELSGIDSRAVGAAPGQPGAFGGWYDSFWGGAGTTAPSPITPSLDGLFPFARIGAPLTSPSQNRDLQALGADALAFTLGKQHHMKVGGEFRYIQNVVSLGGISRGLVVSNNIGEFTNDSETCISCGLAFKNPSFDYALRQPDHYAGDLRSWAAEGFVQDAFNPKSNITINLGLRYELFTQPREAHGLLWNFSPKDNGLVPQGGGTAVDPFDYACGSGVQHLDSLYNAARGSQPWNCASTDISLSGTRYANFAPRFGLAVAPNDKTVIRFGAGMFYDQQPSSSTAQLLQNRPSPLNVRNPSAIYGQNFFSAACAYQQCGLGNTSLNPANATSAFTFAQYQAASGPPAIYALDTANNSTPFSIQFNGSVQRQFGPTVAEVGYVGNWGFNLPVLHNQNFQDEFYCTSTPNCDNISYFPIFMLSNLGSSNYHSMVLKLQGEQWHGLRVNITYTLSRSFDNGSSGIFPEVSSTLWNQLFGFQQNGIGSPLPQAINASNPNFSPQSIGTRQYSASAYSQLLGAFTVPGVQAVGSALTTTGARPVITSPYLIPQNPLNYLHDEWGPSDFNVTNRAVLDFTYDIHVPLKSMLVTGWQASGIVAAQGGQPFTVFEGPAFGEIDQRANLTGSFPVLGSPSGYLDPTAFSLPSQQLTTTCPAVYSNPGTLYNGKPGVPCTGNTGRNEFTGPGLFNTDFSLQKATTLAREKAQMILRAECFNLFNRANYYNPISAISLDGFTTNPQFGKIVSAHDPRQIQLAVRVEF